MGSTGSLNRRISVHVCYLRKGTHQCVGLQRAWDAAPESHEVRVLEAVVGGRDALRDAEQGWLDRYFGKPGCVNVSGNSRRNDAAVGVVARQRMREAKLGGRNPLARGCVLISPSGEKHRFDTGSEAARFMGVSQQLMDGRLRGLMAWPGKGRVTRKASLPWVGWTGYYEPVVDTALA